MSSLIVLYDNEHIFLSSDRGVVEIKDDGCMMPMPSIEMRKIFFIDEKVVFCSGKVSIVKELVSSGSVDSASVSSILSKYDNPNIEILVVDKNCFYHLSEHSGYAFSKIEMEKLDGFLHAMSLGIETSLVFSELSKHIRRHGFIEIKESPESFSETFFESIDDFKIRGVGDFVLLSRDSGTIEKTNISNDNTILYGGGKNLFLVVGDVIIGSIIAGNSLTITSEDSSFTLDENGAVLQNASFTVIKDGTTISINPSDGISINKDGVDTFYVDVDGNLKAGGFSITGTQIYKDSTHYLDSANNVLRWGDLEVDGDTLTVTNLQGSLDWNNLTNVPAANVAYGGSNGYLSGSGVYGGALSGAGGTSIELDSFGVLTMKTNLSVRIQDGTSAGFRVENGNGICDANGGFLSGNGIWSGGDIEANGNIYMSSGSLVATRNWVTSNYSPIGHTHSQYYESGDSPSFYRVTASNDYNIGSYSGLGSATDLRTLTFYDRDGNYHYIYVRGGLITTMG